MDLVTSSRSVETLTVEDFRGHQGARFRLSGEPPGGSAVALDIELADVTEYPAETPGTFRTPFSVLFHGPMQPVAPQGIYRLEHEQFGTLDLFVVPIGPDEPSAPGQAPTAMRYEAVFS
jgi:Domain of unknown function (DUF6916)